MKMLRSRLLPSALALLVALMVALAAGCAVKKAAPRTTTELTTQEKVRLADSYMKSGHTQDALKALHEAMAEEPDNSSIHNFYGYICFRAARYDDAEKAFLRALELDPYLTDARNFLGAVYDQTGRKSEAEQAWKRSLQDPAYPTPEKIYMNLGILYSSQGRDVEAIDQLRRAVEIDPKYYQAHYELASVLGRTGRLEESAREFEVAGPGYRSAGEYYYRLGMTYFRLEERDKARENLMRVLAVAPGSPSAAQADDLLKILN